MRPATISRASSCSGSPWRSPAAHSRGCTPWSPSRTTWSNSWSWWSRIWWPPPCGSCSCAAGYFTPAGRADSIQRQRNRVMTITTDARPQPTVAPNDPPRQDPRPRWVRPAVLALLAATAVLYLWGLGSSGWANNYYAAAAQAGTQDWKAWLFGSLDAGNAITVDKPPAALWVMGLFGRLFGFNAFTMLLPQALMGVAAVALLFATVRRTSGPAAGLIAGAALAVAPVAALMFRFNNPDALLVLLLVAAAYFMVRATETGSTRWLHWRAAPSASRS